MAAAVVWIPDVLATGACRKCGRAVIDLDAWAAQDVVGEDRKGKGYLVCDHCGDVVARIVDR